MSSNRRSTRNSNPTIDMYFPTATPQKIQAKENKQQIQIPTTQCTIKKRKIKQTSLEEKTKVNINSFQKIPKILMKDKLRKYAVQQILSNCSVLRNWLETILQNKPHLNKHAQRVLSAYLHNSGQSLWQIKYSPKSIDDLFFQTCEIKKLKDWITAYEYNRANQLNLVQDSNEQFDNLDIIDMCSQDNVIGWLILKNKWKLKALVIKSRKSIGLKSFIRLVAKDLNYHSMICSVQNNQEKYFKQINQSTKSVNVGRNNQTSKSLNTPNRTHQISSFFPIAQKKKAESDKNSIHIIVDINNVYPEKTKPTFYSELQKSIFNSKVPFIITTDADRMPDRFYQYDFLKIDQPSVDEITDFFWMTTYLQRALKINGYQQIQDTNHFWPILLSKLPQQVPKQPISWKQTKEIVILFRSNMTKIFNYLQFQNFDNKKICLRTITDYLAQITSDELLQCCVDRPAIQSVDNRIQKKNSPLTQKIQILKNHVLEDTVLDIQKKQQCFLAKKMFNSFQSLQEQVDIRTSIDTNVHFKAKKSILRKLKLKGFNDQSQYSSLKIGELQYLKMLCEVRRSRRSQVPFWEVMGRIFSKQQVKYLQQNSNIDTSFEKH